MFFDSIQPVIRIVILGTLAYLTLVILLRTSGKRTLSKWNAFDLVVTVALGSTLATILLSKNVNYTEGFAALGLLILLQFVITSLAVRFRFVQRLVKAEPRFLYRDGCFIAVSLQHERVTEAEVRAAVRGAGFSAMEDVQAVVLETDGSVSVVGRTDSTSASALLDVQ